MKKGYVRLPLQDFWVFFCLLMMGSCSLSFASEEESIDVSIETLEKISPPSLQEKHTRLNEKFSLIAQEYPKKLAEKEYLECFLSLGKLAAALQLDRKYGYAYYPDFLDSTYTNKIKKNQKKLLENLISIVASETSRAVVSCTLDFFFPRKAFGEGLLKDSTLCEIAKGNNQLLKQIVFKRLDSPTGMTFIQRLFENEEIKQQEKEEIVNKLEVVVGKSVIKLLEREEEKLKQQEREKILNKSKVVTERKSVIKLLEREDEKLKKALFSLYYNSEAHNMIYPLLLDESKQLNEEKVHQLLRYLIRQKEMQSSGYDILNYSPNVFSLLKKMAEGSKKDIPYAQEILSTFLDSSGRGISFLSCALTYPAWKKHYTFNKIILKKKKIQVEPLMGVLSIANALEEGDVRQATLAPLIEEGVSKKQQIAVLRTVMKTYSEEKPKEVKNNLLIFLWKQCKGYQNLFHEKNSLLDLLEYFACSQVQDLFILLYKEEAFKVAFLGLFKWKNEEKIDANPLEVNIWGPLLTEKKFKGIAEGLLSDLSKQGKEHQSYLLYVLLASCPEDLVGMEAWIELLRWGCENACFNDLDVRDKNRIYLNEKKGYKKELAWGIAAVYVWDETLLERPLFSPIKTGNRAFDAFIFQSFFKIMNLLVQKGVECRGVKKALENLNRICKSLKDEKGYQEIAFEGGTHKKWIELISKQKDVSLDILTQFVCYSWSSDEEWSTILDVFKRCAFVDNIPVETFIRFLRYKKDKALLKDLFSSCSEAYLKQVVRPYILDNIYLYNRSGLAAVKHGLSRYYMAFTRVQSELSNETKKKWSTFFSSIRVCCIPFNVWYILFSLSDFVIDHFCVVLLTVGAFILYSFWLFSCKKREKSYLYDVFSFLKPY